MNRVSFVVAFFAAALSLATKTADKHPLKLIATIALPGLRDGDFDHFASDLHGHRLFLAAEENGKVLVFDTRTDKLIETIGELKAPHSMVYRQDLNRLFVVDGDDSAVKIYDGDTYKLTGQIRVAIDADSIAYDPDSKYMYVVNGGRAAHSTFSYISVIDTSRSEKLKDIEIDANQIEAIVLEKSGRRLFCNITGKNAVGVLDRRSGSLLATWPLPPADAHNVSLALDEADHRLFVVTRDPGTLVVFNSDGGTLINSVPPLTWPTTWLTIPGKSVSTLAEINSSTFSGKKTLIIML
jgi:DNA-binding beta-propeller fold protein YncE